MTKITNISQLDFNKTYNYADYLTWKFDDAVELIRGKIMLMSPAPNVSHQRIETKLLLEIGNYLKNKRCEVFPAPFDVRLYDRKKSVLKNKKCHTVVQPDLSVICDPNILDKQGCNGSPDWVVEILSPGNSKKEMKTKYKLYQESGVLEYWLIYPEQQAIHQFILKDKSYHLKQMFTDGDIASPHLFPNLKINVTEVFKQQK
jgi:Uma2 family endonuclease